MAWTLVAISTGTVLSALCCYSLGISYWLGSPLLGLVGVEGGWGWLGYGGWERWLAR